MAKKAEIWKRRHADELAGRKAAYYKTAEQLAEEAEEDEDNPDDKDIYDTGDNVSLLYLAFIHEPLYLCITVSLKSDPLKCLVEFTFSVKICV